MKVKVIKSGLPTYWYANRIGEVFEVVNCDIDGFNYKVINNSELYSHCIDEEDCEIMKEVQSNNSNFDMKKEAWFIRTPTPEISRLVQEWLFEQGFKRNVFNTIVHGSEASISYNSINYGLKTLNFNYCLKNNFKEVKLSFKTIIDSVEYPVVETDQQKQIRELEQTIAKASEQIKALREKGNEHYNSTGMSIYQAIQYSKSEAFNKRLADVSFTFNGIEMVVYATSHEYDSALIYSLRCEIERLRNKK